MPKTPAQIEHAITQNSNDIAAIYDMLTGIDFRLREHDKRFDGIDTRLDGIDTRLDGIDTALGEVLGILRDGR